MPETKGIRVEVTDLASGEKESSEFDNDWLLTCAGRVYLDHVQQYPGAGTTVLTIKTRKSDERG